MFPLKKSEKSEKGQPRFQRPLEGNFPRYLGILFPSNWMFPPRLLPETELILEKFCARLLDIFVVYILLSHLSERKKNGRKIQGSTRYTYHIVTRYVRVPFRRHFFQAERELNGKFSNETWP